MARPKNDQPGPSAKERMANAFWEALEEKPYEQITVRDIAERAQINRNALYYHFSNVDSLAEWAFERELPTEIPRLMFFNGPDEVLKFVEEPANKERIRRARLAVGKNGSKMFVNILKDAFLRAWCDVLEIDLDTFSDQQRIASEFIAGGILAVVANSEDIPTEELVQFVSSTGMHQRLFDMIMTCLKAIF